MDILNWCLAHWRELTGCVILVIGIMISVWCGAGHVDMDRKKNGGDNE